MNLLELKLVRDEFITYVDRKDLMRNNIHEQSLENGNGAEISKKTIALGTDILDQFVRSQDISLTPEDVELYLRLAISNTEFSEVTIAYTGVRKKYPKDLQFPDMSATYVDHKNKVYFIWFEQVQNKWKLSFCEIRSKGSRVSGRGLRHF